MMFPGLGEEGQYLLPPAHPTHEKETGGAKSALALGEVREGKNPSNPDVPHLQEGTQPHHLHAHTIQGTLGELCRRKHVVLASNVSSSALSLSLRSPHLLMTVHKGPGPSLT